jgi:hypothetical protein
MVESTVIGVNYQLNIEAVVTGSDAGLFPFILYHFPGSGQNINEQLVMILRRRSTQRHTDW